MCVCHVCMCVSCVHVCVMCVCVCHESSNCPNQRWLLCSIFPQPVSKNVATTSQTCWHSPETSKPCEGKACRTSSGPGSLSNYCRISNAAVHNKRRKQRLILACRRALREGGLSYRVVDRCTR